MTQGRGKVSWAGHSSQEEAFDAVSLATTESNRFFLLVTHMLLLLLLCTGALLKLPH